MSRQTMIQALALTLVVGLFGPLGPRAAAGPDGAPPDVARLQGTWHLVGTEVEGRAVKEEGTTGKCVITGRRIDLRPRIEERQRRGVSLLVDFERVTGTFTPGPAGAARRLTIRGKWLGPRGEKQATFHALYAVDGDTLKILLPPPGAEPPAAFKTLPDSGQQLFVFRRESPEQRNLLGSWDLVRTEQDGKVVREDNIGAFCSLQEGRFMLVRARVTKTAKGFNQEQLEDLAGTYQANPGRPGRLLVKGSWGIAPDERQGTFTLLYEVRGDTLKLLLPAPGKEAPAELATRPGSGARLLTFRRGRSGEAEADAVRAVAPPAPPGKPDGEPDAVKPPPGWHARPTARPPGNPAWKAGYFLFPSPVPSPDGELLGSSDALLDLATGKDLTYHRLKGKAHFLGFSPNGRAWGLLSFRPGPYAVVDWVTGRVRAPLQFGDWDHCQRFALSPDGKTLALSKGGEVKLWDALTGKEIGSLGSQPSGDIAVMAFSPDGKMLATAGNELWTYGPPGRQLTAYLRLWEVATLRKRAARTEALRLPTPSFDRPVKMLFTPDGRRLATPCYEYGGVQPRVVLRFWDARSFKSLPAWRGEKWGNLSDFAFSPDGKTAALVWGGTPEAAAGPGKVIHFTPAPLILRDLPTGKEVARVAPPRSGFAAVAFSADGRLVITQDNAGVVRIWERDAK